MEQHGLRRELLIESFADTPHVCFLILQTERGHDLEFDRYRLRRTPPSRVHFSFYQLVTLRPWHAERPVCWISPCGDAGNFFLTYACGYSRLSCFYDTLSEVLHHKRTKSRQSCLSARSIVQLPFTLAFDNLDFSCTSLPPPVVYPRIHPAHQTFLHLLLSISFSSLGLSASTTHFIFYVLLRVTVLARFWRFSGLATQRVGH
jgi:hypothetical protein